MRAAFALGFATLVMAACAHDAQRTPATAMVSTIATRAPAAAPRGLPAAIVASCAPGAIAALHVEPIHSEDCWPDRCVSVPIWIDNCGREPLFLVTAKSERIGYELEIDPRWRIAPGTRTRFDFPPAGGGIDPGAYTLTVGVGASEDAPRTSLEARVTVVDAALERAKAECAASGGDWGAHGGFVREVGCEPIMRDAGRACSDEGDCQGQCVLEREQVISPTEKRVFGRCSRFRAVFGCHATIGATRAGRVPRRAHFARVCVD